MRILGIDNGLQGGLVLIDDAPENRGIVLKLVMPTTEYVTSTHKKRREYNEKEIVDILKDLNCEDKIIDHVFIEKAQAMPTRIKQNGIMKKLPQGTVASFSTGLGYGILRGIISALEIPYTRVHPKTWQKEMFRDMPKTDTKSMGFIVCSRLWPSVNWLATARSKKPHSGLTDAALIAEFGRRTLNGQLMR